MKIVYQLSRYCTRQQCIYKKTCIVRAPVEQHFAFPDSLDQAVKLVLQQKRIHLYSGNQKGNKTGS